MSGKRAICNLAHPKRKSSPGEMLRGNDNEKEDDDDDEDDEHEHENEHLEQMLQREKQRNRTLASSPVPHSLLKDSPTRLLQKRHRIKGVALHRLEMAFAQDPRPSAQSIARLATETGEPEKRIRIWFNNRRGKTVRLRVDQECVDAALLDERVSLKNGMAMELTAITGDEITIALRDRVLQLQRRLEELRRAVPTIPILPPINDILNRSKHHENPLVAILRRLLSVIVGTADAEVIFSSPREVALTVKEDTVNVSGVLQALDMYMLARRVMSSNGSVLYILSGPSVSRLFRETICSCCSNPSSTGFGPDECIVSTTQGVRVRVDGVCIVPVCGGPAASCELVLRAACSLCDWPRRNISSGSGNNSKAT